MAKITGQTHERLLRHVMLTTPQSRIESMIQYVCRWILSYGYQQVYQRRHY